MRVSNMGIGLQSEVTHFSLSDLQEHLRHDDEYSGGPRATRLVDRVGEEAEYRLQTLRY